ncbi:hypothetical protein EMIT0P74_80341 [Pseudomonas sp. IT-P74]
MDATNNSTHTHHRMSLSLRLQRQTWQQQKG